MKKSAFVLVAAIFFFTACKKENTGSTVVAMEPVDTTAQLKYRGAFTSGPYGTTMGVVKVYSKNNVYSLVLDSFIVSSGPDLHVYLSKEMQPLNFIDLGVLRTRSGTQLYNISGMPDFLTYKFALIHCQQFDHLFGSANLQ
jgi:hypothetical protein